MRNVFVVMLLLSAGSLSAASYQGHSGNNQQWRDTVYNLGYELNNQQSELNSLRERLEIQEQIIDTVRADAERLKQRGRELLDSQSQTVSETVGALSDDRERFRQEILQLQQYSSSIKDVLEQHQARLQTFETAIEQQATTIKTMESMLQTLVDTLQGGKKTAPIAQGSDTIYRVVDGDSLGTIAKKHQVTVRRLKEANNLQSDKIIVGQKLAIPSSSDKHE
jgi:LysM repeat protein